MNPALAARLVLVFLLTSGFAAAMPNAASTTRLRSAAPEAASARRGPGGDYYAVLRGATVVGRGGTALYELTIRGNFDETAQISITIPDSVRFQEIFHNLGWIECTLPPVGGSGTIECSALVLGDDRGHRRVAFTVSVPSDSTADVFVIQARVSGPGTDPELSNNTSEVSTGIVDASSFTSDVGLSFEGPVRTSSRRDAAFLRVVNNGPTVALGILVEADATYPRKPSRGVIVRRETDSVPLWYIDALAPDESATLVLQTNGGNDSRTGSFNSAIAAMDTPDTNAANDTATIAYSYEPFFNCKGGSDSSRFEPPTPVSGDTVVGFVDSGSRGPDSYVLVDIPVGTRLVKTIVPGAGELQAPPFGSDAGTAIFFIGDADASLVLVLEVTSTVRGLETYVPAAGVATSITEDGGPCLNDYRQNIGFAEINGIETLAWDPPDPTSGNDAPPRNVAIGDAARPSAKSAPAARRGDATLVGYNIYRSHLPNVAISPSNLFASVGPTQTSVVVPTAPGGSFFRVAACYATGEGGASNEAEESGEPGLRLTKAVVGANGITAKGSGFTEQVNVSVDGIPFVRAAKVKAGNTKVKQTGDLLIGLSVSEYLRQSGTSELIIRNSNGGTARVRIQE